MDSAKSQVNYAAVDPASHRAYLEAEARALLDYISRLPLDHLDRWILSSRYNAISRELRALDKT